MKELAETLLLYLGIEVALGDILTYDNNRFVIEDDYYWVYSDLAYSAALDRERASSITTLKVALSHSGIAGIENYVDFGEYADDCISDLDIAEVLNPTSFIGEFLDEYAVSDRIYYIFKE